MSLYDKDNESAVIFPLSDAALGAVKKSVVKNDLYELEEHAQDLIFRLSANKDPHDKALLLVIADALVAAKSDGKVAFDSYVTLYAESPSSEEKARLTQGCAASLRLLADQENPSSVVRHLLLHYRDRVVSKDFIVGKMLVDYLPAVFKENPRLARRAAPLAALRLSPYEDPAATTAKNLQKLIMGDETPVVLFTDFLYPERSTKYESPSSALAKSLTQQTKPSNG